MGARLWGVLGVALAQLRGLIRVTVGDFRRCWVTLSDPRDVEWSCITYNDRRESDLE